MAATQKNQSALSVENTDTQTKQSYHHGNVKEALVQAAVKLLESEPVQNLSLRRLAKEVGITPTAVYNHFSDKDALVVAIKLEAFEHFNQYILTHCAGEDEPENVLVELGVAYYLYSRQYSSKFDVLFNYEVPLEANTEELIQTACQGQELLMNLIRGILQKHNKNFNEDLLIKASIMAWTNIHGLVTLIASGSIKASAECQDWPPKYKLDDDVEVKRIIADNVSVLLNGFFNCQCFQVDCQDC